ncbi:hypothetical protein C8Q78DRAFT_386565 [Trametes maxima]|nr:hypothetical protein C8Q78DRAFT_386565 [Trametes maxima]
MFDHPWRSSLPSNRRDEFCNAFSRILLSSAPSLLRSSHWVLKQSTATHAGGAIHTPGCHDTCVNEFPPRAGYPLLPNGPRSLQVTASRLAEQVDHSPPGRGADTIHLVVERACPMVVYRLILDRGKQTNDPSHASHPDTESSSLPGDREPRKAGAAADAQDEDVVRPSARIRAPVVRATPPERSPRTDISFCGSGGAGASP